MIDLIRLRENVACEFLAEGVVFVSERGSRLLTGRAERLVARCLDGSLTLDGIIEHLHSEASAAEVCFVVERLKRDGVIVSGPRLDASERGWEALGAEPEGVERLGQAEIEIVSVGDVDASTIEVVAAAVRRIGPRIALRSNVSQAQSATPAVPRIVVADDYLRSALNDINADSLASGRSWLLVKPIGVEAWVGPFFTPGETGCWRCLAQRLRGHRRVDEYLRQRRAADDVASAALASLPGVATAAAGVVATAVGKWFVEGRSGLEGALWAFDSGAMDWRRHNLVKRPQCPACGDVARRLADATDERASGQRPKADASVKLVARRGEIVDGGLRVASPEQTFERLKHHISPVTGIVSALVDLSDETGAGRAVGPNFLATHAFTNGATDVDELRESLLRASGGKGLTVAQAQAGAVCEALERYSGVFDGTETVVRARMSDLGGQAIDPNASMLFSKRQLSAALDTPNGATPGRRTIVLPRGARRIPAPFDPGAEIDWTPVWSLSHSRLRYLPTAYCYYGAGRLPGGAFAFADSNGSAAGNVIEEAVLQGFLELVERDGVAIWWYNRIARPRVDIRLWNDWALDRMMGRFAELGRETWAIDLTTDLGIPTFAAVSCMAGSPRTQVLLGFGAHLDAQIALRRAVTELVQSLPGVVAGESRPASPEDPHAAAFDWFATATIQDHRHLAPDPAARALTPDDYRLRRMTDLLDAIEYCVEAARAQGLETLVLDQTRQDVGLAVAKVFVPGLRHFWPRFAPGRLYDTPVELGWRSRALEENELNPVPIYF